MWFYSHRWRTLRFWILIIFTFKCFLSYCYALNIPICYTVDWKGLREIYRMCEPSRWSVSKTTMKENYHWKEPNRAASLRFAASWIGLIAPRMQGGWSCTVRTGASIEAKNKALSKVSPMCIALKRGWKIDGRQRDAGRMGKFFFRATSH